MNRYAIGAEGGRWWWGSAALGAAAAAAVVAILVVPEDGTEAASPSRPDAPAFVPGPVNVENSTPTEGRPS